MVNVFKTSSENWIVWGVFCHILCVMCCSLLCLQRVVWRDWILPCIVAGSTDVCSYSDAETVTTSMQNYCCCCCCYYYYYYYYYYYIYLHLVPPVDQWCHQASCHIQANCRSLEANARTVETAKDIMPGSRQNCCLSILRENPSAWFLIICLLLLICSKLIHPVWLVYPTTDGYPSLY